MIGIGPDRPRNVPFRKRLARLALPALLLPAHLAELHRARKRRHRREQTAPLHALKLTVVPHQQKPGAGAVRRKHHPVQDVRVQHRRLIHDHHRARIPAVPAVAEVDQRQVRRHRRREPVRRQAPRHHIGRTETDRAVAAALMRKPDRAQRMALAGSGPALDRADPRRRLRLAHQHRALLRRQRQTVRDRRRIFGPRRAEPLRRHPLRARQHRPFLVVDACRRPVSGLPARLGVQQRHALRMRQRRRRRFRYLFFGKPVAARQAGELRLRPDRPHPPGRREQLRRVPHPLGSLRLRFRAQRRPLAVLRTRHPDMGVPHRELRIHAEVDPVLAEPGVLEPLPRRHELAALVAGDERQAVLRAHLRRDRARLLPPARGRQAPRRDQQMRMRIDRILMQRPLHRDAGRTETRLDEPAQHSDRLFDRQLLRHREDHVPGKLRAALVAHLPRLPVHRQLRHRRPVPERRRIRKRRRVLRQEDLRMRQVVSVLAMLAEVVGTTRDFVGHRLAQNIGREADGARFARGMNDRLSCKADRHVRSYPPPLSQPGAHPASAGCILRLNTDRKIWLLKKQG